MKSLCDILFKYTPDAEARRVLEASLGHTVRADKENRALQIEMDLPALVQKSLLYRMEEEIARAYELNYVKFLPRREAFSAEAT